MIFFAIAAAKGTRIFQRHSQGLWVMNSRRCVWKSNYYLCRSLSNSNSCWILWHALVWLGSVKKLHVLASYLSPDVHSMTGLLLALEEFQCSMISMVSSVACSFSFTTIWVLTQKIYFYVVSMFLASHSYICWQVLIEKSTFCVSLTTSCAAQ